MTLAEAERILATDGEYAWLLQGPERWSVTDLCQAYTRASGVEVSDDTVRRWVQKLAEEGGATLYPGTIGYQARRDALVLFFAQRRHLRVPRSGQSAS